MTASETPETTAEALGASRPSVPTVAVLTWAFLLELAAFGALGYAGWQVGHGIAQLLLVFAMPVLAIVVWGLFVAPRARVKLPPVARLVVELVVYAAAVVGLLVAGALIAGVVLGVLVVAFEVTRPVLRRRDARSAA